MIPFAGSSVPACPAGAACPASPYALRLEDHWRRNLSATVQARHRLAEALELLADRRGLHIGKLRAAIVGARDVLL